MTSAAETYDAMIAAYTAQRTRLLGPIEDRWTNAARFRDDPRRQPGCDLQTMIDYLRAQDTLLDVGGGAGRYALPLALRCQQAIVVDPSAGMQRQFVAAAEEAGIKNVRFIRSDWLDAEGLTGDVSLVAHVTYFVPDIRRFIDKLVAATRRRVIIAIASTPPPNGGADLFPWVHGEPMAAVPGHRELLPVLWEAGILPDVRVCASGVLLAQQGPVSREEALESLMAQDVWSASDVKERARQVFSERFDEIFVETGQGFLRPWQTQARLLLITWET